MFKTDTEDTISFPIRITKEKKLNDFVKTDMKYKVYMTQLQFESYNIRKLTSLSVLKILYYNDT